MKQWLDQLPLKGISSVLDLGRVVFLLSSVVLTILIARSEKITTRTRRAALATALVYFTSTVIVDYYFVNVAGVLSYAGLGHGLLEGIPVDAHLSWAALWCVAFCMLAARWNTVWRICAVLVCMLATVGLDAWIFQLGCVKWFGQFPWWLVDGVLLCALQSMALILFDAIRFRRALVFRAVHYGVGYGLIFYEIIPRMIQDMTDPPHGWSRYPWYGLPWILNHVSLIIGVFAAWELCRAGVGTPLPLDPTRKLVTSGPYAWIRNPMQVSGVLVAVAWYFATDSWFFLFYALDLMVIVELLRPWEEAELEKRFGVAYRDYKQRVSRWVPLVRFTV